MADISQQLIDSLGQIKDVSNAAGDALEALAKAMNEAVTKISGSSKSAGSNKAVQEFVDLIEDKDSKLKKFAEYLKDDVPKAFEELTEDIDKVKKGLEDTADILSQIKKSSGGGGASASGNCPCETVLRSIETHIGTLANTVNGGTIHIGGRVVDLLTNMNRNISKIVRMGGMGGMGGGRNPRPRLRLPSPSPTPSVDADSKMGLFDIDSSSDKILGLFDGIDESVHATSANVDALVDKWMKYVRSLSWTTSYFGDAVATFITQLEDQGYDKKAKTFDRIHRGLEANLREISSHEKDISIVKRKQIKEEMLRLKVLVDTNAATEEVEKQFKKVYDLTKKINREILVWKGLDSIAGTLSGSLMSFSTKVVGGLLNDLNTWERESTNMAATMTANINAAGGAAGKLVDKYRDLLQVSNEVIVDTHQFPGVVRKEWVKAIKKGTRSINETKAAINSGLAAAWQVGASAESTADEFQKWNMNIGMSRTGSVSLARTMSTVAKVTGVMGDNLVQAVAAAREIAQLMKDTGIYSQKTANSIVGWMASAQKFGVDKQVQEIFKASQGGLEAFNQASSETRNLLASSGQLQNVLSGMADPNDVMKGVGDAIRRAIPSTAFNKDKDGKPVGLPDLKKLSAAEISRLDIIMKKRFGMKLGESVRLLEGIQDQNPEEKLNQIEKDLANPRLTKAEKEGLDLQKQQLEVAIKEKKLGKNLDKLGEVSDALKSLPDDQAKAAKAAEQILQSNKVNEMTIKDSTSLLDEKFKRQGKTFNVMGKNSSQFADRMNQLLPAVKAGDAAAIQEFREMQGALAQANKTADSEAKNNSNNLDAMQSQAQQLQNGLQNALKPLHTMVLQAPIWTWYLAMISGGVWLMYRAWKNGRLSENMQIAASTLVNTIGTKGSGWVHDPYVEHFVQNIDKNIAKLAKKMGVADASRVRKKTDNSKTSQSDPTSVLGAVTDKLSAFSSVIDTVKGGFSSVTGYLGDLFGKGGTLSEGFSKVFGMAGDSIKKGFSNTKELLTGKMSGKDLLSKGAPEGGGLSSLLGKGDAKENKLADAQTVLANNEVKQQKKEAKLHKKKEKAEIAGKTNMPKAELPKAEIKGSNAILEGAGKIAGLAAAVVALGVVLVLAAKAIMAMTGFDAKQAKEVAWVLGTVLGAGAFTLFAAAGAAKVMEWANKAITMKSIKDIYMGGVMLMAILPALVLLGMAMIFLGGLMSYFISPKKAEELSWTVASILGAAAIVAGSVVLAAGALMILGALSLFAWVAIPLMVLGALALFALTPAMMGLAVSVIRMAEGLNAQIDVKKSADIASATASILSSAAMIAGAVLASSVALMLLAPMALLAWVIIPIMTLGALALFALTPVVMMVAMAVIGIAAVMNAMVNVQAAKKTAAATADILWSAAKIAGAIVTSVAMLSALAPMALFAWAIIPLMYAGAAALIAFTPAVIEIAKAIIGISDGMVSSIESAGGVKSAKKAGEALQAVGDVVEGMSKILVNMNEKLKPLLGGTGILGWGEPVAEQLKKAIPVLKTYFLAISDSLKTGLLKPILDNFVTGDLNIRKLKDIGTTLKAIGDVVEGISKVMVGLNEKLMPMIQPKTFLFITTGPSVVDQLEQSISVFSDYFKAIAKSLVDGIINPIARDLPPAGQIRGAADSLQASLKVLDLLPKFIKDLSGKMGMLLGAQLTNIDLNKKTYDFANWFYGIGHSLSEGIFQPMKTFPQVSEIETAKNNLEALTNMLDGLMTIMRNLSNILSEIGSIGLDFSALDSVGGIFKAGKLELVINAANQGGFGETSNADETSLWMDKLLGVFTGVRSPNVSNNGGLLRGMKSGFGQALEKPMDGVQKATGQVGTGVSRLGGTMSKFADTTGDVPSKIVEMKELLHTDLVNLLNKQSGGEAKPKADPKTAGDPTPNDWMKNILPYIDTLVTAISQGTQTVKTTVNNAEFDKQVQAKVEQGKPSGPMMDSMEYLAAIAANTAATNESVQEVVKTLEEMKELMGEGAGGAGTPSTKSNTKPRGTPNYYAWQFGRFGDTSAKQYVNNGI